MTNDELRSYLEAKRGRPLTLAERNIDLAGLNKDLNEGKVKLREAIEKEQQRAIRRWLRSGMHGTPRVRATPELMRVIGDLYANGEKHGQAELRKAGFASYADTTKPKRLEKLKAQLTGLLGGLNQRLARRTTELDLGTITHAAIAQALAKVPGALDVASRMISPATYSGLGAAFDKASDQVDAPGAGAALGGAGWEQTAVMDDATCGPCADADGTTFDTWDEAQATMPDGGPYVDCDGETRCRCRLAPVPL